MSLLHQEFSLTIFRRTISVLVVWPVKEFLQHTYLMISNGMFLPCGGEFTFPHCYFRFYFMHVFCVHVVKVCNECSSFVYQSSSQPYHLSGKLKTAHYAETRKV